VRPTTSTASSTTAAPSTTAATSPAIADLDARLTGRVLTSADADYATAALPANARYASIRPAVIAQCADEADVVTSVRWAVENGVPLVPRGGGHNYAGLSTTEGLVIDISALNSKQLDASTGIATVGGSASNQDLLDATAGGPFFLPAGTCLSVCVGGLVLGGGIGYNSRWAGLTCDHLTSTRVVLASGEVVEVDANQEPDLFWACRGATGGTFGIHTSFTFQLVEAPQEVAYFRYDYRGADAAMAIFGESQKLNATAPAAFNANMMARAAAIGDGGPRDAIDVLIRGQYIGPMEELQDLLAPMLAAAPPPTKEALEVLPFWQVQTGIWAGASPPPHPFGDISRYGKDPLPDDANAKIVDLIADCPVRTETSSGSVWSIGWVGGEAQAAIPRTDTAYVHRGLSFLLRPTPSWANEDPPSIGEELMGWTDDVVAVMAPHTPNESYQNFPNRALPDPQQQYFAENLERLIDVKTKYDPQDVFTNEQSVKPR
jgi:hypothetical protein